nr:hypothetical protein [Paraburkholderia hayleyella]
MLQDVFSYTVSDLAGATDEARLVLHLDIAAPFIEAPQHLYGLTTLNPMPNFAPPGLGFEAGIFVTPVVRSTAQLLQYSLHSSDSGLFHYILPDIAPLPTDIDCLNLNQTEAQFVAQSVRDSRLASEQDLARIQGRKTRVNLSADGLLATPARFNTQAPETPHAAPAPQRHGKQHDTPAAVAAPSRAVEHAAPPASALPHTTPEHAAHSAPGFSAQVRAAAQRWRPHGAPPPQPLP